jgi:ActR/RegA family two-component response regulator
LLFVDDELNIRITLPAILEKEGFEVAVASSVSEALTLIQNQSFDILLSDLNVGQPGDGFTVVSAMRRIQPEAATFILTGYPDFETALLAIRNQVDDYFTKPADIRKLVATLREKSDIRLPHQTLPKKRISAIIRENQDEIVKRWLTRHASDPELSGAGLTRSEKIDHVPQLLIETADRIDRHPNHASETATKAAGKHGTLRYEQGYTIPMLLVEAALLQQTIADLLQDHLLAIDISTLIPDMHQMYDAINHAIETSVRAYQRLEPEPETI